MAKQPRRERHSLIYYLEVREQETDRTLGRLADITPSGMKILTDAPIASGAKLNLSIICFERENALEEIKVQAECLWCGPDINPSINACGLRFISPSPAIANHIESIIHRLGFDETF